MVKYNYIVLFYINSKEYGGKMKNKKGISLIALIITIAIMLILAGVVIFRGGVDQISNAKKAKFQQSMANIEQAFWIKVAENKSNGALTDTEIYPVETTGSPVVSTG